MAKRQAPDQAKSANLSAQQMKSAIPKLERRIAELKDIDVASIRERGEPRFAALGQKIDDTLVEIFGSDTIEYRRFHVMGLDTAEISMYGTPLPEVIEGYRRGIERAVSNLQTITDLFRERRGECNW